MIISCICGRRFRTQNESDAKNRSCPQCGGPLRPEDDDLVPALDMHVLIEQMKFLRDELVSRDRQLRKSQAETTVLKAEIDQLRTRLLGDAGIPVEPEKTPSPARSLPSNRVPLFTSRDP